MWTLIRRSTCVAGPLALTACLGPVTPPGADDDDSTGADAPSTSVSSLSTSEGSETSGEVESDTGTSTTEGSGTTSEVGITTNGLGSTDTTSTTRGGETSIVEVAHARELRGAWVASAWNINFPTQAGLSVAAQQAELVEILDTLAALNMNTVVLQIRPESDALYSSTLEPFSRFLTGVQGADPGYDPLAFAIEQAHARGIEVHAWLNPYRAKVSVNSTAAATHVSETMPEFARVYGTLLWMDPGAAAVREHVVDVVVDIASRYAIDGLQFDDYYYPYPSGTPFPDDPTWQAYLDDGGTLSLADWRRENVHLLVEQVHLALLDTAPHVRFGVSPFGIYQPGTPPGINGFNAYEGLYADPLVWIQEEWVDYVAPQLYWATTQPQQAYDVLLEWWAALPTEGRHVFAGNAAYKLGTDPAFDVDELLLQVQLVRELPEPSGNMFYNVDTLLQDTDGFASALADEYYTRPALTPELPRIDRPVVEPPAVVVDGMGIVIDHPQSDDLRAYALYEQVEGDFLIHRIVDPSTVHLPLSAGHWVLSAADRMGTESLGVAFQIL